MIPSKNSVTYNSKKKTSSINLYRIIDKKNAFIALALAIDWNYLTTFFNKFYNSDTGRPGLNIRLMISLHYLKYAFNLSDREILARWAENAYWQVFSGMDFFFNELPIHYSSMSRWRKRVGVKGVEELFKQIIQVGLSLNIIKKYQFEDINIDTTVQEKYVRFPTDSDIYLKAIQTLTKLGKKIGINFIHNYAKSSTYLKYKLIKLTKIQDIKEIAKKLRIYLGKIIKKFDYSNLKLSKNVKYTLTISKKIYAQQKNSKKKIYSFHAPEVECITKGNSHKKYKFGNKVSIAVTSFGGWIVGIKSFHGNPYDGHTLTQSLQQIIKITKILKNLFVDMGYIGHDYFGEAKVYITKWKKKGVIKKIWKKMKRRSAIEPTIGHLKSEHRLKNNRLKGILGDCINPILSASGMNFKKLLKAVHI